jgi:hypothetical protein
MDDSSYFISPLRVLIKSTEAVDVSAFFHDLVDAYSTISARIMHQAEFLNTQSHVSDHPALQPLRQHASAIAPLICRDICLGAPHIQSPAIEGLFDNSSAINQDHDLCSRSLLCLQALRLASLLFQFPSLHSCFSSG